MASFDYAGAHTYNLTFVTRGRAQLFRNAEVTLAAIAALKRASAKHDFTLHAYCFMPDHAHVLASGGDGSSLAIFVRLFKQLSGYACKQQLGVHLWQISYYDHVLRNEEDLPTVASYILDNPVRAGLVDLATLYPYSGPRPIFGEEGRPEGLQLPGWR